MRGRKPKPTALKILAGNPGHRRLRADEPEAPQAARIPRPPKDLRGKAARKMWRLRSAQLHTMGLLPRVAETALFRYCLAWQAYLNASIKVAEHGEVIPTKKGNLIVSPFLAVANRQQDIMLRIEAEFGMTPSSKSRVGAAGGMQAAPGASDIDDRFFGARTG